jgi:hypothetical protein
LLVLFIHGEETVDHHQHLSACNVSLLRQSLLRFGFLDFLPQGMGVSWDTFHNRN